MTLKLNWHGLATKLWYRKFVKLYTEICKLLYENYRLINLGSYLQFGHIFKNGPKLFTIGGKIEEQYFHFIFENVNKSKIRSNIKPLLPNLMINHWKSS